MASTNASVSGELTGPTSIALMCIGYSKAVLALLHPQKKSLSLLGLNKLDGYLHGLREFHDTDPGEFVLACPGQPAKEIRITAGLLKLASVKGSVQGLCTNLGLLDTDPNLLKACENLAIEGRPPVVIGNLPSPSAHYAAIAFASHVLLAVRVAVEGGPYLTTKKTSVSDFDVNRLQENHLDRITELLREFPTYDSPELAQVLMQMDEESRRSSHDVPPELNKVWPKLTATERDLVSTIWRNRCPEGTPTADVIPLIGWESSNDSNKLIGIHLAHINKKLKPEGIQTPWHRRGGRIFGGGNPPLTVCSETTDKHELKKAAPTSSKLNEVNRSKPRRS